MALTTRHQRMTKRPTGKQLDRAFAPLALEIGKLNRAWNMLHEHLGSLFAHIVNNDNLSIPLAVWYSTQSDRSQREMLRAAINAFGALDANLATLARKLKDKNSPLRPLDIRVIFKSHCRSWARGVIAFLVIGANSRLWRYWTSLNSFQENYL